MFRKSLEQPRLQEQALAKEPVFATPEELAEKEELLQSLKQAEQDKSIEGLNKQKEILIKLTQLDERRKQRIARERREIFGETIIKAKTKEGKETEINLEIERQRWQEFYNNHNFKDKVNIPELSLTEEQIKEVQTLTEQGFVDSMAVVPDHLAYQELESEMVKGYRETFTGPNFDSDGGFAALDKQEKTKSPSYRILFYKKVQNLEGDKILKETKGQSPDQMEENLISTNKKHNTDIQGISLKDYLIIQREFAETTNTNQDIQDKSRHMDENGWTWCLKSRFKKSGRVVFTHWVPEFRWLLVNTNDSSYSYHSDGSRLSRSFEIKTKEK